MAHPGRGPGLPPSRLALRPQGRVLAAVRQRRDEGPRARRRAPTAPAGGGRCARRGHGRPAADVRGRPHPGRAHRDAGRRTAAVGAQPAAGQGLLGTELAQPAPAQGHRRGVRPRTARTVWRTGMTLLDEGPRPNDRTWPDNVARGGEVDAVVIGAGPNGLTAANVLADQGWSVLVLEAQPTAGGAVRSAELVEPGFLSDMFSAFYPLGIASPWLRGMHLDEHGLEWAYSPTAVANPDRDGRCAYVSRDLDETAASLDSYAPGDGDAWRRLTTLFRQVQEPLIEALLTPFPPVGAGARIASRLGPSDLLRFARFAVLPVRRMADEEFCGKGGGILLGGNALHSDLGPESPISGFMGWLLCMLGQTVGFPAPVGGAGALTSALVRRLESRGGPLTCDSPVEEILVADGRARGVRLRSGGEVLVRRAVLADVDAPSLYLRLLPRDEVPGRV